MEIKDLLIILIKELKTSNRIKLLQAKQQEQKKYIQDEDFIEAYNKLIESITKNTIEGLENEKND